MNDKMPLIKKLAQKRGINMEPPSDKRNQEEENIELKEYLARVSLAQKYLRKVNENTVTFERLRFELPNVYAEREKEYSNNIDLIIDETLNLQQKIKHIIDLNTKFVKENEKSSSMIEQEKRIVTNLHGSLVKHFQDAVTDYQLAQSEIKNIKQNKTVRNAEIVIGRKLDNQEKENIINDPKIIQDMLKSKLLDPTSTKFANALNDIEERHNDIIKLEKSVNQVHQLFLELAALVNLQGEIIDNIYENIEKAKADVLSAEEDVITSKKNMQSARKKKCIILIIVIVVILVIVGPILGVKVFSA